MSGRVVVACLIGMLMVLAGCSQRPEGSPSFGTTRSTAKLGDRAEYSRRATVGIQVTGSTTATVVAGSHHKRAVSSHIVKTYDVQFKTTQQSGSRKRSYTTIVWYGEDVSGNLYLLGQSLGGKNWAYVVDANAPLVMPADLSIGRSWSYTANFSDSTTESVQMECVGSETLTTKMGQYDAHKVRRTGSHSGVGGAYSGYIWLSSDLPLVFELKGQNRVESRLQGTSVIGETEYLLEKLTFAP